MSNKTEENKPQEYFNRSTLEVAKSIIDKEEIATRSKKYLKEESRLCFLSVWVAFNSCFSTIIDLYEDPNTPEKIKEKVEALYKGIPPAYNLALEARISPSIRNVKLSEAEKTREESGKAKMIVKGYTDQESLESWEKLKQEDTK